MKLCKFRDVVSSFFKTDNKTGYLIKSGKAFELGENDVVVDRKHLIALHRFVDAAGYLQPEALKAFDEISEETKIDAFRTSTA